MEKISRNPSPNWTPAGVAGEIIAARQVRQIKDDILRGDFQPISKHLPAMGLSEKEEAGMPADYVAVELTGTYEMVNIGRVVQECLTRRLETQDSDVDTGVRHICRNGKYWLAMPNDVAKELMGNLKSGRSIASQSVASLQ